MQNQKLILKIQAYHPFYIQYFLMQLLKNINAYSPVKQTVNYKILNIPMKKHLFTVLRSPHIDKKARDQFEMRIYQKKIILTGRFSKTFLNFFILWLKTLNKGIVVSFKIEN